MFRIDSQKYKSGRRNKTERKRNVIIRTAGDQREKERAKQAIRGDGFLSLYFEYSSRVYFFRCINIFFFSPFCIWSSLYVYESLMITRNRGW